MDSFIASASALSQELLPSLAAIALIFLIAVLRQATLLLKQLGKTLEKTENTFSLVDQSLSKIQDPLDTVAKISHGIDSAYDSGAKAVNSAKDYLKENKEVIKEKVSGAVEKVKQFRKTETVHEPSPEDILRRK